METNDSERELAAAIDDLIAGRGVGRGRHSLIWNGRNVAAEFGRRLAANGFFSTTVRDAPIEPGERLPAFCVRGDTAEFGWIRWEIFTPRSRRKLFASERRRSDNDEWAVQIGIGSAEQVFAQRAGKESHDVETVVPAAP